MITEKNIYEKGTLIAIHIGRYEGRKKLTDDQLKGLPTEIVRGVHDLFDKGFKELLKKIASIDGWIRQSVRDRTVAFPIKSVYFVKAGQIDEIIDLIEAGRKDRESAITEAIASYEDAIVKFAEKYPDFYAKARTHYISKDQFQDRFYLNYQFIKIAPPDQENALMSPEMYKKEMMKFRQSIDEMKRDVLATIAQSLLESAETLRDQCTDGKPNQRTLNNLNLFLDQINKTYMDFIDRKDMKQAIDNVRKTILGVDAESLRDIPEFKKEFKDAISQAAKVIQVLPDIPLKRAIEF